jgi:hypothetical protein
LSNDPFTSAKAALVWAVEEWLRWFFGQAQNIEQQATQGTDGGDGVPVRAWSILQIAVRHDVYDRHGDSCLLAWYVDEVPERQFSQRDLSRLAHARHEFEAELVREGYVVP